MFSRPYTTGEIHFHSILTGLSITVGKRKFVFSLSKITNNEISSKLLLINSLCYLSKLPPVFFLPVKMSAPHFKFSTISPNSLNYLTTGRTELLYLYAFRESSVNSTFLFNRKFLDSTVYFEFHFN